MSAYKGVGKLIAVITLGTIVGLVAFQYFPATFSSTGSVPYLLCFSIAMLGILVILQGHQRNALYRRIRDHQRESAALREQQYRHLIALFRVSRSMRSDIDLQAVFDCITSTCHETFESDHVSLMKYLKSEQQFEVSSVAGCVENMDRIGTRSALVGAIPNQASKEGKVVLLGGRVMLPGETPTLLPEGASLSGAMMVPIIRNELLGVLNVGGRKDGTPYGEDEMKALQVFAETAGTSIHLMKQLKEARESLEDRNRRLYELYKTAQQVVDNVSHEFRTPLTVIKEYVSAVCEGLSGDLNEEQQRSLTVVLGRVEDLSAMVNDMLDMSRIEAGIIRMSRRPGKLEGIVERVRPTLTQKARAGKVELRFAIDRGLPEVFCDHEKIGRIMINLIVNATKFCGEGGTVRLWARHDMEQAQVTVGVTDDGPGIAPENLQKIFERFKQVGGDTHATSKGFGLGLNIVKELVQLNFGDLAVASEQGSGSTFSFTIPTVEPLALLEKYMKRVEELRNPTCYISLLCVTTSLDTDAAALTEVENLLEEQLRRSDLLLRTHATKWLLVAPTDLEGLSHLTDRLTTACVEGNRLWRCRELPAIELDIRGCWRTKDQMEEFIQSFERECETRPRAIAPSNVKAENPPSPSHTRT